VAAIILGICLVAADFVAEVGDVGREFLAAALIRRVPIGGWRHFDQWRS